MTTNELFLSARRAGVLLHPTSLPDTPGNGDLGQNAYRFIDFLKAAGLTVWQILPHGPTHDDLSPYHSLSAHAGNPLWISLEALVESGCLDHTHTQNVPQEDQANLWRIRGLQKAKMGFESKGSDADKKEYDDFINHNSHWLNDFALYYALRQEHGAKSWLHWPVAERDREPQALVEANHRLADSVSQVKFEQYIFFKQWYALKRYANDNDVLILGDLPVYVAHDSVDVWAHRNQFDLDPQGKSNTVAGVPPDCFSKTGQHWGNPQYNWNQMESDRFQWWRQRLHTSLTMYDFTRIDHFRGFESYWSIPADADTAEQGQWLKAPGEALFAALQDNFGPLPVVAEDLGMITPEVDILRKSVGLPGMKVLQFAFDGGDDNPHLPECHEPLSVVYTGTHDNDTALGWFQLLSKDKRIKILEQLENNQQAMPWPLIETALASVANLAIIPMQDFLELGAESRMNTPATAAGNWTWRFQWQQLPSTLTRNIFDLVKKYNRETK